MKDRRALAVLGHGALAVASALVVAAVLRTHQAEHAISNVAIWFAATGIALGAVVVPYERDLAAHRSRFPQPAIAATAAGLAAVVATPAGPATMITAAAWAALNVPIAARRAEAITTGTWTTYARSHTTEALWRAITAAAVAVNAIPAAAIPAMLAAGALAALVTLPRTNTGRTPASRSQRWRLAQHVTASAAAAWILHGVLTTQDTRNPTGLATTLAVATTARAALWVTPGITALAAHQHRHHASARTLVLLAPVAIVMLTPLTLAGASLLNRQQPPLLAATTATIAVALIATAFVAQQHLIATGRQRTLLSTWAAAAAVTTTLWAVVPAQPAWLFTAQAIGAATACAALVMQAAHGTRNPPPRSHPIRPATPHPGRSPALENRH